VNGGAHDGGVLETARLRLEPLMRAHADALFAGLADARLYDYIAADPPASVDALRARFARWESRRSPDGAERWLNWAVCARADGRALGTVQATVYADGRADVAYLIARAAWGCGYGREAVAAMIAALAHLGVRELRATVDTRNRASIALLTALGFVRVAVRVHAERIHGAWTDEAEYRRYATTAR
jgi:RimJ/RimL family protein N-acetyltransferase